MDSIEDNFITRVIEDALKRASAIQAEAVQDVLLGLLRAPVEEDEQVKFVAEMAQLLDALEQKQAAHPEVLRAGREALFLYDKLPPLSEEELGASVLENAFFQALCVGFTEHMLDAPMMPHDEAVSALLDLFRQDDDAREGLRLFLQGETLEDDFFLGHGAHLQMYMDAYRDALAEAMAKYDAEKAGA
jgi:hypothetical protein